MEAGDWAGGKKSSLCSVLLWLEKEEERRKWEERRLAAGKEIRPGLGVRALPDYGEDLRAVARGRPRTSEQLAARRHGHRHGQ